MSHFGNSGHHLIVAIIDYIPNGWVMFNGDMTNDPCPGRVFRWKITEVWTWRCWKQSPQKAGTSWSTQNKRCRFFAESLEFRPQFVNAKLVQITIDHHSTINDYFIIIFRWGYRPTYNWGPWRSAVFIWLNSSWWEKNTWRFWHGYFGFSTLNVPKMGM